jgi:hypothetical protein
MLSELNEITKEAADFFLTRMFRREAGPLALLGPANL